MGVGLLLLCFGLSHAVRTMRVEVGRSRFGQREFVVPSRETVLQALTYLYVHPMAGDALALVQTRVVRDTRFPIWKLKSGLSTSFLETSRRRVFLARDHLSDVRGLHTLIDAVLATLMSYISSDFLPQNIEVLKHKLEGRLLYVQVCVVGEDCE